MCSLVDRGSDLRCGHSARYAVPAVLLAVDFGLGGVLLKARVVVLRRIQQVDEDPRAEV